MGTWLCVCAYVCVCVYIYIYNYFIPNKSTVKLNIFFLVTG